MVKFKKKYSKELCTFQIFLSLEPINSSRISDNDLFQLRRKSVDNILLFSSLTFHQIKVIKQQANPTDWVFEQNQRLFFKQPFPTFLSNCTRDKNPPALTTISFKDRSLQNASGVVPSCLVLDKLFFRTINECNQKNGSYK